MPYIPQEQRRYLNRGHRPRTSGELNYILTRKILTYIGPDPSYSSFNSVIGVLECVKQELYRRMVALYEDEKCAENGDVFPSSTAHPHGSDCAGCPTNYGDVFPPDEPVSQQPPTRQGKDCYHRTPCFGLRFVGGERWF